MPLPEGYEVLLWRGNFSLTVGLDYSGSLLRATFGGGFSETEVIFPPLRVASLKYDALHSDMMMPT